MLTKKAKIAQIQQERRENAATKPRIYTREQWARYNAERKLRGKSSIANLHVSNAPAFRNPPKSYTHMCGVSQSNVAYKQTTRAVDSKVLLPNNAQHHIRSDLQQEFKERVIVEHCNGQLAAIQELIESESKKE